MFQILTFFAEPERNSVPLDGTFCASASQVLSPCAQNLRLTILFQGRLVHLQNSVLHASLSLKIAKRNSIRAVLFRPRVTEKHCVFVHLNPPPSTCQHFDSLADSLAAFLLQCFSNSVLRSISLLLVSVSYLIPHPTRRQQSCSLVVFHI